jgi:hypothetical protein
MAPAFENLTPWQPVYGHLRNAVTGGPTPSGDRAAGHGAAPGTRRGKVHHAGELYQAGEALEAMTPRLAAPTSSGTEVHRRRDSPKPRFNGAAADGLGEFARECPNMPQMGPLRTSFP